MKVKWWYGKVAYQIYPRSFMDGNGDGIGDLRGIIAKLDYLKSLGIDIVWLSPVFLSPGVDNGYDISDYRRIDPVFGTMADFDELVAGLKARGIKLILDLVVNHCSDEHPMFREALAHPEGEAAECFYFVRGRDGGAPDNLRSYFGGSVWEKVPGRDDLYYLHYFAKGQPDLNWNNPKLRHLVYDMIGFWLDKGVAGFRIDAIMNIAKDTAFAGLEPDAVGDGMCAAGRMTARLAPRAVNLLREMRDQVFAPRGAFTVGEAFGLNPGIVSDVYGPDGCFDTVFDFTVREAFEAQGGYYAFPAADIDLYREGTFRGQAEAQRIGGFAAPILENHDEPRAVSLYLRPELQNADGAKALATVFMFLRGLPFIYQGQEIGLTNTDFSSLDEFRDLQDRNEYRKCLDHGLTPKRALEIIKLHGRDNARTPMPWSAEENGGFCAGRPWIRTHQDYKVLNVAAQEKDPDSVLNYYRRLIALRKDPAYAGCVASGTFEALSLPQSLCVGYVRATDTVRLGVYANFSPRPLQVRCGAPAGGMAISCGGALLKDEILSLEPGGAAVLRLL